MEAQQPAVRHAQAAHHGTGIEMALHVTAGRHRRRHRRQDHRQQGGQPQKALGPVQHAANLGPGIAGIFQPLAPGQLLSSHFR
jgi:hypothetical protein